ncbi:glycerol-3-phosphate 1-O-acyltransferase PlsY [Vagococcus sp.]|uniref:glycerol-3-phosphate 1-O-acyltransferase PlsY n=1 Tax=Vagococcus sp. TaxID=1933889 RepID=UPI003F94B48E
MKLILLFFLAYMLGSIQSGVWLGKIFYHKDIRDFGSGNTGTTNTFRVLGKKPGTVVLILDILKGTIATLLPLWFNLSINPLWFGVAAILGHTFPIFGKFKGGKAVATSAGMLLAYSPTFFIYSFSLFIILLFITSMVSLSSMISAVAVTLSTIVLPLTFPIILSHQNWLLTILATLISIFIIYRHRDNIKRIKNGSESLVPFGLNYRKSIKKDKS